MKLRRIRKNDKLGIKWNAENHTNTWLFANNLTTTAYRAGDYINPLNAYSLLYYRLRQSSRFSIDRARKATVAEPAALSKKDTIARLRRRLTRPARITSNSIDPVLRTGRAH